VPVPAIIKINYLKPGVIGKVILVLNDYL